MKINLTEEERTILLWLSNKGIGTWFFNPAYDLDAYEVYQFEDLVDKSLPSLEEKGFIKVGILKLEKDYAEDQFLKKFYELMTTGRVDDAKDLARLFDCEILNTLYIEGVSVSNEELRKLLGSNRMDSAFGKDLCDGFRIEVEVFPKAPEYIAKNISDFSDGEDVNTTVVYHHKTFFDEDKSFVSIQGKQFKVRKHSRQYEVLRVIFSDTKKDWQLSEVSELVDTANTDKYHWKTFYNYLDAIRKNIAIHTGIKDFFILTTQSVKIQEKYLEDKEDSAKSFSDF